MFSYLRINSKINKFYQTKPLIKEIANDVNKKVEKQKPICKTKIVSHDVPVIELQFLIDY